MIEAAVVPLLQISSSDSSLKIRTNTGDPGCMPFLASNAKVSFDRGTSAGGGIVGVLEQAATSAAAINKASRTKVLAAAFVLVPTNTPVPVQS